MADTTSRFAPPWDGPRLSLDLDALAHNWRTVVAASAGQRIGAVVKNDAYGLGVQAIAPALWALGFAASAPKHYSELFARFAVGGAMLVVAPHSLHSAALTAFGWLLIVTTAVMAIVPWRVHRRFTEAAVPQALRFLPMIGVTSAVLGGLLLWSTFTASAGEFNSVTQHPRW